MPAPTSPPQGTLPLTLAPFTEPKGVPDVLLCGALAFDHIGLLTPADGALLRARQPGSPAPGADLLPRLNLKLDRLWLKLGGCALNVGYGLAASGLRARPLAVVGDDFSAGERDRLKHWSVSTDGLLAAPGPSARAFVFTDPGTGNQLTTFYPMPQPDPALPDDRAQLTAHYRAQRDATGAEAIALLPAEERWQLLGAQEFATLPLRVWNPGQFVEHLSLTGAQALWEWATLVILNHHEWSVLESRLPDRPPRALIISNGAEPVRVVAEGQHSTCAIPTSPVSDTAQLDPTGCGDALLAGALATLASAPERTGTGEPPTRARLMSAVERGIGLAQRCLRHSGAAGYPMG